MAVIVRRVLVPVVPVDKHAVQDHMVRSVQRYQRVYLCRAIRFRYVNPDKAVIRSAYRKRCRSPGRQQRGHQDRRCRTGVIRIPVHRSQPDQAWRRLHALGREPGIVDLICANRDPVIAVSPALGRERVRSLARSTCRNHNRVPGGRRVDRRLQPRRRVVAVRAVHRAHRPRRWRPAHGRVNARRGQRGRTVYAAKPRHIARRAVCVLARRRRRPAQREMRRSAQPPVRA